MEWINEELIERLLKCKITGFEISINNTEIHYGNLNEQWSKFILVEELKKLNDEYRNI